MDQVAFYNKTFWVLSLFRDMRTCSHDQGGHNIERYLEGKGKKSVKKMLQYFE